MQPREVVENWVRASNKADNPTTQRWQKRSNRLAAIKILTDSCLDG